MITEVQQRYHEIRFRYNPARAAVWKAICEYLQPWVKQNDGLLELGAGYGEFCRQIHAAPKWALDQNSKLAEYWGDSVTPLIRSATDPLPLVSGSIGTVFASNFFEHFTLEESERILQEARRVLHSDGRLIVVQPNFRLEPRRYYDDYTHRTAFTDNGFRDFLRALDWRIVHSEPRFLPFSMRSRMPKAEFLVRLYLSLPIRPRAGQFLVIAEKS